MADIFPRPNIIKCYHDNMVNFLSAKNPGLDTKSISDFVKTTIKEKIKRPQVANIVHKNYGDSELEKSDLLNHIIYTNDKIITPSGAVYCTTDVKSSFVRDMISQFMKDRKAVKKEMFRFKSIGNNEASENCNYEQSTIKTNTNSHPGAMGSKYNSFYDLAGYNAVTSISRMTIMLAYANAERFLEGNFYLRNYEQAINFIISCKMKSPSEQAIWNVINKHNLLKPMPCDVADFIIKSVNVYNRLSANQCIQINTLLENTPAHQLAFIFYVGNMKHVMTVNEAYFKKYIKETFDFSKAPYNDNVALEDVFKLDEDLVCMLAPILNDMLKGRSVYSLADKSTEDPDTLKKFINIANYVQARLDYIWDIFNVFMELPVDIADTEEQKFMFRKCVTGSDTDSVLFTTNSWVEWYTGEISFEFDSLSISTLMIYLLSKTTEKALNKMSMARGAKGKDIYMMKMKNEFYYSVFVRCPIKKHYFGLRMIQEGKVLPELELDVKGLNFKSSNLQQKTLDYVEESLIYTLNDVMKNKGKINPHEYINRTIVLEKEVWDSVSSGEILYVGNTSIKPESEYETDDPYIHYNYRAWQKIFAPKYGDINLPIKAPIIPLVKITSQYLDWLSENYPDIKERFDAFMAEEGKNKLNRIPICPYLNVIPEELRPIVDVRSITYKNAQPMHLLLTCLGISLGNLAKTQYLYKDIYDYDVNAQSSLMH